MRRPSSASSALLISIALVACAGRRIPGTDIEDTPDTRAVVGVIAAYREAVERRDAKGVLALASEKYFDDAGTPDPADDVDYQQLKARITGDFQKITSMRLEIGVRRVEVDKDTATAYVFYDEYYRIMTKAGEVAKHASDTHRMQFVREKGAWRFTKGL